MSITLIDTAWQQNTTHKNSSIYTHQHLRLYMSVSTSNDFALLRDIVWLHSRMHFCFQKRLDQSKSPRVRLQLLGITHLCLVYFRHVDVLAVTAQGSMLV